MGLSTNYFNMFIVPETREDATANHLLKEAILSYGDKPFTTSMILKYVRESFAIPGRNVSDAVVRLAKAGILQVAESDEKHDNLYMPVEEFGTEKTYMWVLLNHAIETSGVKPGEITTELEFERKFISDKGIVHTSTGEPAYSVTKRMLMRDLGVLLEPKGKSTAEATMKKLYGTIVAEIGVDGAYTIGILNGGKQGEDSLGAVNPHGKKKVWLGGHTDREGVALLDRHTPVQNITYAPLTREQLLFAFQCAGLCFDAAEKYIPDDECFKAF